jgi:hypothetical protein
MAGPRIIEGIKVYLGDIPEELRPQLEKVEPSYSVNQGARGPLHKYDANKPHFPDSSRVEILAREAAERDSVSDGLRDKAVDMALEQIAKKASEENSDIVAIANPRLLTSRTQISDDPSGYRGAITIQLEADGYKSTS